MVRQRNGNRHAFLCDAVVSRTSWPFWLTAQYVALTSPRSSLGLESSYCMKWVLSHCVGAHSPSRALLRWVSPLQSCQAVNVKVSRLYPPNEGSLAGCQPPVRYEPGTHWLRGWTADFPAQVPRRLLECRAVKGLWGEWPSGTQGGRTFG